MPLVKSQLETAIENALDKHTTIQVDTGSDADNASKAANARNQTAKDLAQAVHDYLKSAMVVVTKIDGITADGKAVTGTGEGKLK